MKAHAISQGLVHFRSESQSIIVIELSKYKGRAVRKSGSEIYCQIDSVRSTLITKYVRLAHDFITSMGGMLINHPAFFGGEGYRFKIIKIFSVAFKIHLPNMLQN